MPDCWLDEVLRSAPPAVAPCPIAGAPLVAILVGGIARGFDRERQRRAFVQHLLKPFAPAADLFLALKVVSDPNKAGSRRSRSIATDVEALRSGVTALRPRAWHLSHGAVDMEMLLRPPASARLAPGFKMGGRNTTCFLAQRPRIQGYQSTIRRAVALMEAAEGEGGRRYDVVVFTRPDLLLTAPMPRWCDPFWAGVVAGTAVHSIGQDFAFFMPRAVAAEMAAMIDSAMRTYQAKGVRDGARVSTCTMSTTEMLAPTAVRRVRAAAAHAGRPLRLVDTHAFGGVGPQAAGQTLASGLVRGFDSQDPSCPERPFYGSG